MAAIFDSKAAYANIPTLHICTKELEHHATFGQVLLAPFVPLKEKDAFL